MTLRLTTRQPNARTNCCLSHGRGNAKRWIVSLADLLRIVRMLVVIPIPNVRKFADQVVHLLLIYLGMITSAYPANRWNVLHFKFPNLNLRLEVFLNILNVYWIHFFASMIPASSKSVGLIAPLGVGVIHFMATINPVMAGPKWLFFTFPMSLTALPC